MYHEGRSLGKPHRRYQRLFIDPNDLENLAANWEARLTPLWQAWKQGQLSEAEVAAIYLLIGLQVRSPDAWLAGPSRSHLSPVCPSPTIQDWIPLSPRLSKWLSPTALISEVLSGFSLRGVRLCARETLLQWMRGDVDLRLLDHVPSPDEMLDLQAQGGRWISLMFKRHELAKPILDGRDALSFLLHDLGHAWQFFVSAENRRGQISFYRMLQKARDHRLLDEPSLYDTSWPQRLDYLIADLNTHPVHFALIFWASARRSFEVTNEVRAFSEWRAKLYQAWQLDIDTAQSFEKLVDGFCPKAAEQVIKHLQQLTRASI